MPELEPITREEKFLNGEVGMTPITREEKILAGEDVETITRREYFLKKYRGGGGGDVTVVPLSVTENGTYSEEGKAYSPVNVNVPLPQNAYLNKSLTGLPADIATFNDGEALPLSNLKVGIEAVQSGSGDPSPQNERPISGWSSVNVVDNGINQWDEETELGMIDDITGANVESNTRLRTKGYIPIKPIPFYGYVPFAGDDIKYYFYDKDKNYISNSDWEYKGVITPPNNACFVRFWVSASYGTTYNNDISINYPSTDTDYHAYNGHTYTIALGDTYYGGYIDWENNVAVVTHGSVVFDGSNDEGWIIADSSGHYRAYISIANIKSYAGAYNTISELYKCSMFVNGTWNGVFAGNLVAGMTGQNWGFGLDSLQITDVTGLRNWLSTNQIQIVYELATPITIPLQLPQVKTLEGVNNLFVDCGQVQELSYFSKEV